MASYYVWSGATGSANGTSWANAYLLLETAFTGKAAGDVFYVAHDHTQTTTGNRQLNPIGNLSTLAKIICVNRAGSVPPVSADRRTTAQITATGWIQFVSYGHYDGIIFTFGTATGTMYINDGNLYSTRLDNCAIIAGGDIRFGGDGFANYTELNNTTVSPANTSVKIWLRNGVKWRNTPNAIQGTMPTLLFLPTYGYYDFQGVDFSGMGSGKTLVESAGSNTQGFVLRMLDCKLNALVNKTTGIPERLGSGQISFIRCDSAGTNYAIYMRNVAGVLDHEITITRTGGASDGTTPISWRVVTSVNSSYALPFETPSIAIWNDVTGSSVTATVEGIWGGGAVPNDNDVWVDVEYLSDASSPQASFVNDGTPDLLTAAAAQTSSSATWGGSTTKFKLNVSFTAQQKGWIYCRVKCAKASSTFYIDPLVTLT